MSDVCSDGPRPSTYEAPFGDKSVSLAPEMTVGPSACQALVRARQPLNVQDGRTVSPPLAGALLINATVWFMVSALI